MGFTPVLDRSAIPIVSLPSIISRNSPLLFPGTEYLPHSNDFAHPIVGMFRMSPR